MTSVLDDVDLRRSLDKVEEELGNWADSVTGRKFSYERGFTTNEYVGDNGAFLVVEFPD